MTALDSLRVYQVTALYGVDRRRGDIDLSDEQIAAYNRIHTVKPRALRRVA